MNATVSLAIIAKNEENDLDRCLESVKGLFQEIVVVDTGSTDKTKEVAQKHTDKVFDFEWIDDFSAARNYSFELCTRDFIFWLDADDVIKPEDAEKIRNLDLSDKEIVTCNYEYAHDEFGNSICTVPRERFIKRSLGLKWEQPIHEYIPLKGEVFVSDISIHHYKKGGTSERNLKILRSIVEKNPEDSRNVYYLGKELQDFGRIDEAIKWFTDFVERKNGFWEDEYHAHYRLAQCYQDRDDVKFKDHLIASIRIEERRAEPYYLMGSFYESRKEWERAIHWYKLCVATDRPKGLLASYQPEYYTWLPRLQLCVCCNAIGDMENAYKWNDEVLKYRPEDSRALSNKPILATAIERKKIEKRQDGNGKKLNLGCGGKTLEGYTNADLFHGPGVDEVFDLDEIPYRDGTIGGINSEHSLEHVGWIRSDKALREWHRVLQPGGVLMLKLPDFEHCCQKYLETPHEDKVRKQWYKYTIYGIQQSQAGEPDEAQTHVCGYSKREIDEKLKEIGFIIDYSVNYDGWDTPSTGIRALKPASALKVGWISPISWEAAQTRIRVLNVNRWLRSRGYQSDIVNYTDIINGGYNVAIVGKSFDEHHYKNIKMLKQHGKTVFCDLCENIIGFSWVNDILAICDRVICCSRDLEAKVKPINPNTMIIEDSWEA